MSAEPRELYSLLIPLRQERLLVPRMCVAEVIAFAETKSVIGDEIPDWYLGTIDWNGRQLPVVSFDGAQAGEAGTKKRGRTRIVVFHAVTKALKGGYYGILTQGFPQLVRVNPDVLTLHSDQHVAGDQPVLCRARMIHEFPLIPDIEHLEERVAAVLQSAQISPERLQ